MREGGLERGIGGKRKKARERRGRGGGGGSRTSEGEKGREERGARERQEVTKWESKTERKLETWKRAGAHPSDTSKERAPPSGVEDGEEDREQQTVAVRVRMREVVLLLELVGGEEGLSWFTTCVLWLRMF